MTGLPATGWLPAACVGVAIAVCAGPIAHRAAARAHEEVVTPTSNDSDNPPRTSGPLQPTWLLSLIGASAAVLIAARFGWSPALPAYLVLVAVTAPLSAIDLAVHKLPDRILGPAAVTTIGLLGLAEIHAGTWHGIARALTAALLLAVVFLVVAIAAGGSFGLGDVKLLALSGLYLGYLGWRQVVVGLFATFVAAAVVGVGIAIRTRRLAGSPVVLGPAILGGTLLSLLIS
jgi:leader peptidase (prepilin peptidase)/N-methyltransferase